jgi:hypothetical protein
MPALVAGIPLRKVSRCVPHRDGRDKFTPGPANGRTRLPGHDIKYLAVRNTELFFIPVQVRSNPDLAAPL